MKMKKQYSRLLPYCLRMFLIISCAFSSVFCFGGNLPLTKDNLVGEWKSTASGSEDKYVFYSDYRGEIYMRNILTVLLFQEESAIRSFFVWKISGPDVVHIKVYGASGNEDDLKVRIISRDQLEIDGETYSKVNSDNISPDGDNNNKSNTDNNSTGAKAQLDALFLHPLGLDVDIRTLNPLKFEKFLQKNNISYSKTVGKSGARYFYLYDNIIMIGDSGVELPLLYICFDMSNNKIFVRYDSMFLEDERNESFRKESLNHAESIAKAFREGGFTVSSFSSDTTYEAYDMGHGTIFIHVYGFGDVSLSTVLEMQN